MAVPQGGLSNTQAQGIQTINKQNIAKGMTKQQSMDAIRSDPNFAKAQTQYNIAPAIAPAIAPIAQKATEAPFAPQQLLPTTPSNPTVGQMRANQTSEEQSWQAKQDSFSAANPAGTKVEDIVRPTTSTQTTTTEVKNTPTGTITTNTTPTEGKIDYNTGKGRENEILQNLNEGYKNDENIKAKVTSGDYEGFKQAYGYDTADGTKKQMLDAFFQAHQPKDKQSILNTLLNGQQIQNVDTKKSPAYTEAMRDFSLINQFGTASGRQIFDAIEGGALTEGSPSWNIITQKNPQAYAEYAKMKQDKYNLDQVNGKTELYSKILTKGTTYDKNKSLSSQTSQTEEKPSETQNISDKITANLDEQQKLILKQNVMNDPNILSGTQKVTTLQGDLQKTQQEINDLEDTIRKQYANTGATEGYILGKVSVQAKDLYKRLNSQNINLQTESNLLQNLVTNYKTDISQQQQAKALELQGLEYLGGIAQKKEDTAKAQEYQTQQDERNFAQQKELAQYQQDLSLQGNQAEFDQKVKQQAQLASDPYTAISTVMDEYKKLGVPFTQSIATKVADANEFIAGGGTIGEYVDKMIGDIQKKPEYQALNEPKPTTQPQVWTKLDDTTLYNQVTGEAKPISALTKGASATDLLSVPDGTIIPSRLSETTNPNNGKECAEFVNDVTQLGMGDTYASKVAKTNTQVHEEAGVGNVAVWNPNPKDPEWNKYGHTGIITKDLGDSWEIVSSNLKGNGAISRDIIPKSSINSYNTEKKVQVPDSLQTGYTEDDYINKITSMLPSGMKDNKSEMDRITKIAKTYKSQNMTPMEAVLKFSGYDIQDKTKNDVAMQYLDIGDNLLTLKPKNYESTISKYINKGDIAGLDTYINGLADDKVKDRYGSDTVSSTAYKVGNDRTDTIISLINRNKDKVGAFDGRVKDFIILFQSDPEYQKLKTILTMSQADTRKYFAGSAVTATEMKALKDFIGGETTMNPDNLISILETIKDDRNNTFETQRRGLLPPKTQKTSYETDQGDFTLDEIESQVKEARSNGVPDSVLKQWLDKYGVPYNN